MTERTREAVDRAINGLWAGMYAETILLELLQVLRALEDDGRIDAQEALAIAGAIVSGVMRLRA